MGVIQSTLRNLDASGALYRSNLTPSDWFALKLSQFFFQLCTFIPPAVYYSKLFYSGNTTPKFPATISYTIRAGFTHRVHHFIWALGWTPMLFTIYRHGDHRLKLFIAQMLGTGILTTGVCALSENKVTNDLHALFALMYMSDNLILARILDIHPFYKQWFLRGAAMMGSAMIIAKHGYQWNEGDGTKGADHRALTLWDKRILFLLELLIMVGENILFYSFVSGMTSGKPKDLIEEKQRNTIKEAQGEEENRSATNSRNNNTTENR